MKYCPKCQKSYPDSSEVCPDDNNKLADFDVGSLIGKVIDGKYEILNLLGLGGMGGVFRARHVFINNEVAIKLINPKLASHEEIVERFLREARAAALIDHPNAVKVTDFGRAEDMLYLVMEFVPGYNLTQLIRKKGHLSPSTTANIMSQICAALDDAHAKKIIHRDLKPDNVMIKVDRGKHIVKVFDYGIAKMVIEGNQDNSITRAGTIVGTVNYMSPEQCRGESAIDFRSDIYSLGVVAFEMMTGRLPFTAPTPTGLAVKHIVDPPPSMRTIVSEIPDSVDKAVLRALNKEPNDRYSSAGAFASELLNSAHSEGLYGSDEEFPPAAGISTGDYNKPKTSAINSVSSTQINTQTEQPPVINKKPVWLYAVIGIVLLAMLAGGGYVASKKMLTKGPAPAGSQIVDKNFPDMVLIPGGWVKMGSDEGVFDDERPVHDVYIEDFYIDITPITNAQFEKFVNETKYVTDAEKQQDEYDWRTYATSDHRDHPVVNISWNDAQAYAKWAGKRLPSEAEWEYAARGGLVGQKYPWGKDEPEKKANYGNAELASASLTGEIPLPTKPVKSYQANGYGLYGMSGNIWQWCNDWYEKTYYFNSPEKNPPGPASGKTKVLRGGSWYTDLSKIRVSARINDIPDGRQYDFGFRCAKSK